jgi:hypothetical protein
MLKLDIFGIKSGLLEDRICRYLKYLVLDLFFWICAGIDNSVIIQRPMAPLETRLKNSKALIRMIAFPQFKIKSVRYRIDWKVLISSTTLIIPMFCQKWYVLVHVKCKWFKLSFPKVVHISVVVLSL